VLKDFPAKSIPMEPENLGSLGLISFGFLESRLNELLFELSYRFFQKDMFLDHFGH
jgi:hypothetical protein